MMKNYKESVVERVGLGALHKSLMFGTLFVTLAVGLLLIDLSERYKFRLAKILSGFVFAIGLFLSYFTAGEIVERMRNDRALYLRDAVAHTFYSYVMYCSFLPIVGPRIGRFLDGKKYKNPFTDTSD